jgi:hypothetical protein
MHDAAATPASGNFSPTQDARRLHGSHVGGDAVLKGRVAWSFEGKRYRAADLG